MASWLPGRLTETVVLGDVDDEILRIARNSDSALVVIGGQTRGGVGLALLGSTAQHVVRAATCPVLVVRESAASA
jgi:universal stress protein F